MPLGLMDHLSSSPLLRRAILLLVLGQFLGMGMAQAKVKLLVITSSNLKIFLEVAQQLPRQFDADYQVVPFAQSQAHLQRGNFDGVVALGLAAAQKALTMEKRKPVFFAGVVTTQGPLFKAPNAIGVDINPSAALHITRLKKTLPGTKRLGVMMNVHGDPRIWSDLRDAAKMGGIQLEPCQLTTPKDLGTCTESLLVQKKVEVILALPVAKVYDDFGTRRLVKNATAQKVALIATGRHFADTYQFLYALAPDGPGTAMDIGELLKDRFLLRKSLPNLNAPQYLVQVLNGKVMKLMGVSKPPPNHVRVIVPP